MRFLSLGIFLVLFFALVVVNFASVIYIRINNTKFGVKR